MRHIFLVIAAALPLFVQAAPTYQFDLTGDQFVDMLAKQPVNEQEYRARERAYAYLDGAKDAVVGTAWCPTHPRKTHELAYDAAEHIKGLRADLRKGNAARLLLTYLSNLYPCTGGRK